MIPRVDNLEKFQALEKALRTFSRGNISVEEISKNQAVFLGHNITEEQIRGLIDLIAGWIGRTPIARYSDNRLVLSY
jgi:hypothetical protein